MSPTCNISIYPKYILHVSHYMCNIDAYHLIVLYVYYICNIDVYPILALHVYQYSYNTYVEDTCVIYVIHIKHYTIIYYWCDIIDHIPSILPMDILVVSNPCSTTGSLMKNYML